MYIFFPLTQSDPSNVAIISGLSECPLGMATVWRNRALNMGFVQRVHPKKVSLHGLSQEYPMQGLVVSTNLPQTNKQAKYMLDCLPACLPV